MNKHFLILISTFFNASLFALQGTLNNPFRSYFLNIKETEGDSEHHMQYYEAGCWTFLPLVGNWQGREKPDMANLFKEKYGVLPQEVFFPRELIDQLPSHLVEELCNKVDTTTEKELAAINKKYEEHLQKMEERSAFFSNAHELCKNSQEALQHKLIGFQRYLEQVLTSLPLATDIGPLNDKALDHPETLIEHLFNSTKAIINSQQENLNYTQVLALVQADLNKTLDDLVQQTSRCQTLEVCESARNNLAHKLDQAQKDIENNKNTIALLQQLNESDKTEIERLKKDIQQIQEPLSKSSSTQFEKCDFICSKKSADVIDKPSNNRSHVKKGASTQKKCRLSALIPVYAHTSIGSDSFIENQNRCNTIIEQRLTTLSARNIRVYILYPITITNTALIALITAQSNEKKTALESALLAVCMTVMSILAECFEDTVPPRPVPSYLREVSTETWLSAISATLVYPFVLLQKNSTSPGSLSSLHKTMMLMTIIFIANDVLAKSFELFAAPSAI